MIYIYMFDDASICVYITHWTHWLPTDPNRFVQDIYKYMLVQDIYKYHILYKTSDRAFSFL